MSNNSFMRLEYVALQINKALKFIKYLQSHSIVFLVSDYYTSKMFKEAPTDIIDILKNKEVTVNYHQFCIVDEVSRFQLDKQVLLSLLKSILINKI